MKVLAGGLGSLDRALAHKLVAELRALGWGAYFLKDDVKSLKTAGGSMVRDPVEAPAVIAEMREYRREIEGGVCG